MKKENCMSKPAKKPSGMAATIMDELANAAPLPFSPPLPEPSPAPAPAPVAPPARKVDLTQMTIQLPVELVQRLKVAGVEDRTTLRAIITDAAEAWLALRGARRPRQ